MNSPTAVRELFGTVLQPVCHFKVDVIAGVANAAAYMYNKQEYQDLSNSSVVIMLREMQREINMGLPFENKLHVDSKSSDSASRSE